MKKYRGFLISLVVVVIFACSINWKYVTYLLDLEKQAAFEIATDNSVAAAQLNYELDHMTVWNFINVKALKFLPKPDDAVPAPSAVPAEDFDIDKVRDKLKTDPDTVVFWSGVTTDEAGNVYGGQKKAAEIAKSKGGVTLEIVMEKNGINPPPYKKGDPESEKAWAEISKAYASQASGTVWGVIGRDLRAGNIWELVEYRELYNNPDVTKIILIEPMTMEEKVLLDRE